MNSLTSSSEKIPQFANASMKDLASAILSTSQVLGFNLSSQADQINHFFGTGGYSLIPAIALVDDLNELGKRIHKISDGFSLSAHMGFVSVSSEVVFDLYELSTSVGQVFNVSILEGMANTSSNYAMNIKTIGAVMLALSAIDEAYAEIYQKTGFLGSKCSGTFTLEGEAILSDTFVGKMLGDDITPLSEEKDSSIHIKQISAVLRASEVTFAAISNIALFAGQGPNPVFSIASLISNGCKYLRMGYNYVNEV
jgi:hypothetical protein